MSDPVPKAGDNGGEQKKTLAPDKATPKGGRELSVRQRTMGGDFRSEQHKTTMTTTTTTRDTPAETSRVME